MVARSLGSKRSTVLLWPKAFAPKRLWHSPRFRGLPKSGWWMFDRFWNTLYSMRWNKLKLVFKMHINATSSLISIERVRRTACFIHVCRVRRCPVKALCRGWSLCWRGRCPLARNLVLDFGSNSVFGLSGLYPIHFPQFLIIRVFDDWFNWFPHCRRATCVPESKHLSCARPLVKRNSSLRGVRLRGWETKLFAYVPIMWMIWSLSPLYLGLAFEWHNARTAALEWNDLCGSASGKDEICAAIKDSFKDTSAAVAMNCCGYFSVSEVSWHFFVSIFLETRHRHSICFRLFSKVFSLRFVLLKF